MTKLKTVAIIFFQLLSAYREVKKKNEFEQIEQDPVGWFANHFNGMRNDAGETNAETHGD